MRSSAGWSVPSKPAMNGPLLLRPIRTASAPQGFIDLFKIRQCIEPKLHYLFRVRHWLDLPREKPAHIHAYVTNQFDFDQ